MNQNLLLLLLFLSSFFQIKAQEFKLGKVTIAELQEKQHPKDTAAVAAILFKTAEVRFVYSQEKGFDMVTDVKVRIKIYKKEGYEWANQKVGYYIVNSSKEDVTFTDAVTYNLVEGKIEKTKLKRDGEFDETINKYWAQKKITMPNIKEGSVIEYRYVVNSPRIGELKDWNFQTSIPVNYSEFETSIPEYFVYKTNQKGYVFPVVTAQKKPRMINYVYTIDHKNGSAPTRSNETLNFMETVTKFVAENLPAMKDESFVNNIENYTCSVSHELSMTRFPNQADKFYSTDWNSVVKTIYEYDDFGSELNKTGYFEEEVGQLIKGMASTEEKIAAILGFVKTKVKWNGFHGYSCEEGVKKAYKTGVGNVADINLMLTAMLRFSEIKANPVLVSTRSNGIALFPNRGAFNYVIAGVETDKGLVLLDATEIYSVPNILPLRDLNWFGRLIRKDGSSEEVDLIPKTNSKEIVNMNMVLDAKGSINGKIKLFHSNHEALKFRQRHIVTNKESYLESLENKYNNIEINDYVRENELDLSKPIVENYSFRDTKTVEIINDKIYLSPMVFFTPKENPFRQEVREYPVDFGYPIQEKFIVNIEIPEGYVVESLPEGINMNAGENIGSFKYIIANTGTVIQLVATSDIYSAIISPEYYPTLKEFCQKSIDKQKERIVFKKI
jgi:hypothetical protein